MECAKEQTDDAFTGHESTVNACFKPIKIQGHTVWQGTQIALRGVTRTSSTASLSRMQKPGNAYSTCISRAAQKTTLVPRDTCSPGHLGPQHREQYTGLTTPSTNCFKCISK